jgi:hypothetical protein
MLGSSGARSIIMYRVRTAFECGYGNPSPACWLRGRRFATFRGQCKTVYSILICRICTSRNVLFTNR